MGTFREYLNEQANPTVKTGRPDDPVLMFDLKNNTVTATHKGVTKTWKVKDDRTYAISIQKTQIKAIGGVKELYAKIKKTVDERFGEALYFPKFVAAIKRGYGK